MFEVKSYIFYLQIIINSKCKINSTEKYSNMSKSIIEPLILIFDPFQ